MSTRTNHAAEVPDIETTRWRIDPARSRIQFRTRTFWGLIWVKGRFERYDGTLDLSGDPPIELTVEANSLNTKNEKRDQHLRSAHFFGVADNPNIRYVAHDARLHGERLEVLGWLHAAGKSLPLDLTATLRRDHRELVVEATAYVDHRHLGMTWNRLGMMRPPSKLIVQARLVQ